MFTPLLSPATSTERVGDLCSRLFAAASIMLIAIPVWMSAADAPREQQNDREAARTSGSGPDRGVATPEWVAAGYLGVPYTHPSDVRIEGPGVAMTAHDVAWIGRPFKAPIYYGLRVTRWNEGGASGAMLDFTHSKAISERPQPLRLSGTRNGEPVPAQSTIGETFRHLEFSHGHNMLTLNGLWRPLGGLVPLAPYVGAGAGINIPHTEVALIGDAKRTYEYQYTGPTGQALAGLEVRLSGISLFIEYKFSFSWYAVPLFDHDGGWFPQDLWNQFRRWWTGSTPERGWLWTTLASHNVAFGAGARRPVGGRTVAVP
jgi:lipid A oxidase